MAAKRVNDHARDLRWIARTAEKLTAQDVDAMHRAANEIDALEERVARLKAQAKSARQRSKPTPEDRTNA